MRLNQWLRSPWWLLLLVPAALLLATDFGAYRREGIAMTVAEDSVTSGGVTVEILNATDTVFWNYGNYDREYRLQRRLGGLWLPMRRARRPAGTVCAASPAFLYEKGVPQRFRFTWKDVLPFDALAPGQYRLIQDFWEQGGGDPFPLAAEFTVPGSGEPPL